MVLRVSRATGNFSAAATWGLVEPTTLKRGAANAIALSGTVPNTSGTTRLATGTTLPAGPTTFEMIGIRLESIQDTTGTITVQLVNTGTGGVFGAVTVNVADLPVPVTGDLSGGWLFFKPASTFSLGAVAVAVDVSTSVANAVTIWRNSATAGDWDQMLVTTTQAAPAGADELIVAGNYTGAGAGNSNVVTMDNNSTTAFGAQPVAASAVALPALEICAKGTLAYSRSATTNLRLNGCLIVRRGGTYDMGTVASPIPTTVTAVLEFGAAATPADGDYGFVIRDGATVYSCGSPRTAGKPVWWTLLTADAAANAGASSALNVADDTGWLSGDQIAIASTTQVNTQCETGTLTANAGANSLSMTNCTAGVINQTYPLTSARGLLNAHSGTAPMQAEIILLTRNVKIRSTSATIMTYLCTGGGTVIMSAQTVNMQWTEFVYFGVLATDKRGLDINVGNTSSVVFQYCSLHDFEWQGFTLNQTVNMPGDTLTVAQNALWCIGMTSTTPTAITVPQRNVNNTKITIDGNIIMRCGGDGLNVTSELGTVSNNRIIGAGGFGFRYPSSQDTQLGNLYGQIVHACAQPFTMTSNTQGFVGAVTAWRCVNPTSPPSNSDWVCDDWVMWGNGLSTSIQLGLTASVLKFRRLILSGDATYPVQYLIGTQSLQKYAIQFEDCDFTQTSGGRAAPTIADIFVTAHWFGTYDFRNCKFNSPEVGSQGNMSEGARITSQRHNGVDGAHKTWTRNGTQSSDTAIFKTAAPSERIAPALNLTFNTVTINTTAGSNLATVTANWINLFLGRMLMHTSLPPGTKIVSWNPATRVITMSQNALSTATGSVVAINGWATSGVKQVAVAGGASVTVKVWVRKSAAADTGGVDYSSLAPQPRLMQKGNNLLALSDNVVLATAAAAVGTWEQLTATVTNTATDAVILEFYVDCGPHNGTIGYWINVDDWTVA